MHTKVIVIGEDPESELEPFAEYEPDDGCSGMWDWHCIGGRWEDSIVLKEGGRTDRAKKGHIDFDAMDKVFGAAVVMEGNWHQRTLENENEWPDQFLKLMDSVKNSEVISVYDCHS